MIDLRAHLPFNLYPGEMTAVSFMELLETAMDDIQQQKRPSKAMERIIGFLTEHARMNPARLKNLNEIERNAFIARGFWLNQLRRSFEGAKSEYNPLFPLRINPWLSGKIILLKEVMYVRSGPNAERVLSFLATWKELVQKNLPGLITT